MTRKATFSPKTPKKNSSDHNSRKEIPKYLIETDPNFQGNYYERLPPYLEDGQFKTLAKKIYNKKFIERVGQNQKMQKKQVEALLKEVVISTEIHHGKEDIIELFDMLKREKEEENHQQKSMKEDRENRLKPDKWSDVYNLPKKLKVKRKTQKVNLSESGYHILEIAGHADEGHFVRTGKWDGLSYYPGRDIMLKEDGKWYIKSNELSERKDEEVFDVLADMSEFEKVYNYHWHVKYTDFNLETGLTARFSKGEMSGEGRLKKVAEHLGLRYVPEEKIPLEQGVKSIKEQHHIDRQNKYRQLMLKFEHLEQQQQKDSKFEKIEQHLAKQVSSKHEQKRNTFDVQNSLSFFIQLFWLLNNQIQELQEIIANKVGEITSLVSKNEDIEEKHKKLNHEYEAVVDMLIVTESDLVDEKRLHEKLKEKFDIFKIESDKKIYELQSDIENYKKSIKDKDNKIDDMENTLRRSEIKHEEEIEIKNNEIQLLQHELQKLKKDVFSETWTQKDKNGENQKSKNVNVVKQLEKKSTELEEKIKVLKEQVEELKNPKPVIKEIPAQITIDDVKSFKVKADGENITVIDLFNRKNKAIKELKEQNTSLSTKITEKDVHIADLEQEIESDEAWIYTGEIYEVLDVSETYTNEVRETWKEKAQELEEKVEELKAEVSQLQKVIDGVKGLISKVFSAFGVGEDEPDGLEKINNRLATMESLKNPKKENSQSINQNTATRIKF